MFVYNVRMCCIFMHYYDIGKVGGCVCVGVLTRLNGGLMCVISRGEPHHARGPLAITVRRDSSQQAWKQRNDRVSKALDIVCDTSMILLSVPVKYEGV